MIQNTGIGVNDCIRSTLNPYDTISSDLGRSGYRDGYMDLRGNFFKADWRTFKVDNGTTFAVDMRSIAYIGSSGGNVKVVAYLTEGDDFDPNNLISFAFDCKGVIEIVSNASIASVQPVEEQVRELACH